MTVGNALHAVLDSLDGPRLIIRSDYTVAYANKAFRERFGVFDFAGHRCHELLFHELNSCSECGEVCPLECAAVTHRPASALRREIIPGAERFLELEVTPIPAPDGEPLFFMESVTIRGGGGLSAPHEGIVAESPAVRAVLKRMARVTALDIPVLFEGEEGSGKERFAKTLHENSRRAAHGFIVIACQGLTVEAFDEEFLGRLTPSGRREGGLADALGGTVYFDEVADLSPALQQKLLQLMETGVVRGKGAADARAVDCRVICATKFNLKALAEDGRLRRDLYYRLNVCPIRVPPLRERLSDMRTLSGLILKRSPAPEARLTPDAHNYLCARSWPGNVRELVCLLDRATLFAAQNGLITRSALEAVDDQQPAAPAAGDLDAVAHERRRLTPEEASAIQAAAQDWRGSRKMLAEHFGVSERTLYRLLARTKRAAAEGEGL